MRGFAGFAFAVGLMSASLLLAAQETPVYGVPGQERLQYFMLEQRSAEQMTAADAALLNTRNPELLEAATFYGYEMSGSSWSYEQPVCPLMPDMLMLHYSIRDAAGADSIFVALVPRSTGQRVRIVPVLTHGATQFTPAAKNPRNFQLFNQLVPADVAQANNRSDGQWLLLSMCYAAMTGAQPQVPNRPELDMRLLPASSPMLRMTPDGKGEEVRFAEPISPAQYTVWDLNYNKMGRIVNASAEMHSFAPPVEIVRAPEPAGTPVSTPPPSQPQVIAPPPSPKVSVIPPSPAPAYKTIPPQPEPTGKVIAAAPPPKVKVISGLKEPPVKVIQNSPPPPVKEIPRSKIPEAQPIPDAQPQ